MIPLYTPEEFKAAFSKQKLALQCKQCNSIFYLTKHRIQDSLNVNCLSKGDFCSPICGNKYYTQQHCFVVVCDQCGLEFNKNLGQIKATKHNFCSHSCAATYSNTHKTTGTRRSKLEKWLEEQLTKLHPELKIDFNRTDAIEAELDIFFPSLKLAFELNGIFHYEPIYGADKLASTLKNDNRKILACAENGIELCIIDNSQMRNFKEKSAQKFLDIIEKVIAQAISRRV